MVELISASSLSSILAALPVETLLASLGGFDYALRESSLPGQVLVGLLLVLSCFSWAVMITKFRVLAKLKARNAIFLDKFREAAAPMDLYEDEVDPPETPFSSVYQAGCSELDFHARRGEDPKDPAQPFEIAYRVNPAQTEAIRHRMDRAVGDRILELESQMTVLATAVSGAPFLGLLGTVWGVMDTFAGVAGVAGGASLQVMAPGVSAALVTTVIALLVAIPAMFGYNYLVRNIRVAIASMEQFAAEISTAFERRYTDYLDSRESTPPAPRPAAAVLQPAPEPSPTPPDETPPPPAKAESPAPAPLGPPPFTKAPVEPAPAPALEASKPVEAPAKKELSSTPAYQETAPPPPPPAPNLFGAPPPGPPAAASPEQAPPPPPPPLPAASPPVASGSSPWSPPAGPPPAVPAAPASAAPPASAASKPPGFTPPPLDQPLAPLDSPPPRSKTASAAFPASGTPPVTERPPSQPAPRPPVANSPEKAPPPAEEESEDLDLDLDSLPARRRTSNRSQFG